MATIMTIEAKTILGRGFPPLEGAKLADHVLEVSADLEDIEVDLRGLPAGLLISAFFNGFLQRVADCRPAVLARARQIDWHFDYEYQRAGAKRSMKSFKPRLSAEQP